MGVLGLHLPPVAGIAVAAGCDLPKDCPPVSHRALISLTCQISGFICRIANHLPVRERPHTQDTFSVGNGIPHSASLPPMTISWCMQFAVSVMSSGCYEDDTDTGETFILTGEHSSSP